MKIRPPHAVALPAADVAPGAVRREPAAGGLPKHGVGELDPFGPQSPRRPASSTGLPRVVRSPGSTQRLGRLRHELARIHPAPSGVEGARAEIIAALARAGLGDWAVPDLTDETITCCTDGSVQIPLLSHLLLINPSGAFRIVDLLPGRAVYFEMPARGGNPFVLPLDAATPG